MRIRNLGIQHLIHNPELFIESNTEHSWQFYLNNMSREGTWADIIIIQAVANSMNLRINIIESLETFSPITVINPRNTPEHVDEVYIGHIGECHYVSTSNLPTIDQRKFFTSNKETEQLQKRREYMTELMRKKEQILLTGKMKIIKEEKVIETL